LVGGAVGVNQIQMETSVGVQGFRQDILGMKKTANRYQHINTYAVQPKNTITM